MIYLSISLAFMYKLLIIYKRAKKGTMASSSVFLRAGKTMVVFRGYAEIREEAVGLLHN